MQLWQRWPYFILSSWQWDSETVFEAQTSGFMIIWIQQTFKICFPPLSIGHNLAEVVSVHAYLCSGKASLIWLGEASLEYVQDDAQVFMNGLIVHPSIFHHFIPQWGLWQSSKIPAYLFPYVCKCMSALFSGPGRTSGHAWTSLGCCRSQGTKQPFQPGPGEPPIYNGSSGCVGHGEPQYSSKLECAGEPQWKRWVRKGVSTWCILTNLTNMEGWFYIQMCSW